VSNAKKSVRKWKKSVQVIRSLVSTQWGLDERQHEKRHKKRDEKKEMKTILEAKNLKKHFPIRKGFFLREVAKVKAVDGVSFQVRKGETLGLVGESGCGKSTLGKTLIRLHEPTSGDVYVQGENFQALKGGELRRARKNIQMIFQDPFASLDPRMTVSRILEEPLKVHHLYSPKERQERVKKMMETVGLQASYLNRYPHEFSGGQRQRISIARAIMLNPEIVIADEPVSALDVSIQAQILNLMKDLQEEFDLTYLFISHDLSVVEHICDRIAVMYLGKIVEIADRDELFSNPKHPYTRTLIEAIPKVGLGKKKNRNILRGEVPSPISPPSGCHFHPRCAKKFEGCDSKVPEITLVGKDHWGSCHLYPSDKMNDVGKSSLSNPVKAEL
jgi:oligopeptide transport system ATP-binding protein